MRLRRFLDRRYDQGRRDGAGGNRRDPAHWGEPGANVEPYARWAYEAGYREGVRDLERLRLALIADRLYREGQ